jgi:hypothetical protein
LSYEKIRGHPPDFEVRYRFFKPEEGGRYCGPPWQHYRGDWSYAETPAELYMIHPEFIDENGERIPDGLPVPWEGRATMWVLIPERRAEIHRARIQVGVQGFFMEGNRKVAEATVIRVLNLHGNPDKS